MYLQILEIVVQYNRGEKQMANEFVSREEFENLKKEVTEIKDELGKSGDLLNKIDKKTDIIFEKLDNFSKVSSMQIEPLNKDIKKNAEDIKELKSNSQWAWRSIARDYHCNGDKSNIRHIQSVKRG